MSVASKTFNLAHIYNDFIASFTVNEGGKNNAIGYDIVNRIICHKNNVCLPFSDFW